MKLNKYLIIFYVSLFLTGIIFLLSFLFKLNLISYIIWIVPILCAFFIIFKRKFTKKLLACFGLIILFQVALIAFFYLTSRHGAVVATTDDLNQVFKIQKVLLDNGWDIQILKYGNKYDIIIRCDEKEHSEALVALAESDTINQDEVLSIGVHYGKTYAEALSRKLTKIIYFISGVDKVDLKINIPDNNIFEDKEVIPLNASIYIETDESYIPQRIEKTVKNLMLRTVPGLTEDNLNINIKVNKCAEDVFETEYYRTARKLYNEHKYSEALELLEEENKIFPNKDIESINNLKDLILLDKQIAQRANDYKLYRDRGDTKNVSVNGGMFWEKGSFTHDFLGAVEDFTKALELAPNAYESCEIYERRALAYDIQSQSFLPKEIREEYARKAIQDYTKSLEIYPNNAIIYYSRAEVYYLTLNDEDKAIDDFKAVIKYSPIDFGAYKYLGDIYFKREDYKSAIEYYEGINEKTFWKRNENDVRPPLKKGIINENKAKVNGYTPFKMLKCYKELKQYDKAQAMCEKIIEKSKDEDYIKAARKELKALK